MTFGNFQTKGAEVIRALSQRDPNRCSVLADAIEAMLEYGVIRATLLVGDETQVAIYLTPSRFVLRGVPTAAALVRIDYQLRIFELIHVIDDYVDNRDWADAVRVATAAI